MIEWARASGCEPPECVEIAVEQGEVFIRTSELVTWHFPVRATRDEFAAFVAGVKAGEFDHLLRA